ncbi:hypothetical protein B0H67DRAFT_558728 [Lasiosphaeris hirsuta]|uniref:Uncharacterized protein n=1 Tax=Lasiosphaeris hirsuta TaxID=260670 RepID=A0AA40DFL5_9PEZI|nr:hypothetical protein B0H67DRAFT_558728 [Lasiosphaeris hirsuta]
MGYKREFASPGCMRRIWALKIAVFIRSPGLHPDIFCKLARRLSANAAIFLFWAPRGAGDNFGIVTSMKYKIYDRVPEWSKAALLFMYDKLKQVLELANSYVREEDQPRELMI